MLEEKEEDPMAVARYTQARKARDKQVEALKNEQEETAHIQKEIATSLQRANDFYLTWKKASEIKARELYFNAEKVMDVYALGLIEGPNLATRFLNRTIDALHGAHTEQEIAFALQLEAFL